LKGTPYVGKYIERGETHRGTTIPAYEVPGGMWATSLNRSKNYRLAHLSVEEKFEKRKLEVRKRPGAL